MSVMMMVNSIEYLQQEGNWLAFLNKAAFCRATQRRLYLWVGDLPRELLDERRPVPWMNCEHSSGNTLNIYKALAFLALFMSKVAANGVLYLDADAWFSDTAFYSKDAVLEDYFQFGDNTAFLFGNQNRYGGPLIPLNGGLLAVRDSPAARRFLALWWWSRCGRHDQLPLWATLFATIAANAPDASFSISPTLFSTYNNAHLKAVAVLAAAADRLRQESNLVDSSLDGGSFRTTRLIDRPLELPGTIIILPSAPIARSDSVDKPPLPALRSDINASAPTFCCHTRLDRVEGDSQCVGSQVCSRHKSATVSLHSCSLSFPDRRFEISAIALASGARPSWTTIGRAFSRVANSVPVIAHSRHQYQLLQKQGLHLYSVPRTACFELPSAL